MTAVPSPPFVRKSLRAFTLVEVMIALMVFAVGSVMIIESLRTSMFLMDKNVSMNEANTNLQYGYYKMLNTLESAAMFVDCATYSSTSQTFTAVSPGAWGNAVRFMQLLPITCYVEPDDSSGYSVSNPPPPTTTKYLQSTDQYVSFSYNPALYNANCVTTDAYVLPTYPEVSGTVTGGSSPGVKPGLGLPSSITPGLERCGFTFQARSGFQHVPLLQPGVLHGGRRVCGHHQCRRWAQDPALFPGYPAALELCHPLPEDGWQ